MQRPRGKRSSSGLRGSEEASKARAGRKTGIRGEDVVQGWGCHVLGGPGGHGKELGRHFKCEEFEHGSTVIDGRFLSLTSSVPSVGVC